MKKQIFTLVLFVMATFASVNVFGQANLPPTCIGDALHPSIGQQYAYTVTIPNTYAGYNGDGTFQWWVTQDVALLTGAVEPDGTDFKFLASGVYNLATASTPTVNITWNSTALGKGNYYLVTKYVETNTSGTAGCASNNVKVTLITPRNTFWLKIENAADNAGAVGGNEVCAPNVSSAIINTTTDPGAVEYLYGVSTHYVKISANGYTGNFVPTLQLGSLIGDAEYTSVTWTSGAASGIFTGTATGGVWNSNNPMPSLNTYNAATNTWGDGQVIIVTIQITHNHHQGLTDMPVAIAIDGTFASGATTMNDIAGGACTDEAAYADATTQILRARPGINASAPAFIPEPTTQP